MKKIVQVALLSGLLFGSALADDLLAKVSGGALTENSVGVKKLSDAEMAEVKGGWRIWYGTEKVNGYINSAIKQPYKNNYNANKYPQTVNQPIYSNHWCERYGCLSGRY